MIILRRRRRTPSVATQPTATIIGIGDAAQSAAQAAQSAVQAAVDLINAPILLAKAAISIADSVAGASRALGDFITILRPLAKDVPPLMQLALSMADQLKDVTRIKLPARAASSTPPGFGWRDAATSKPQPKSQTENSMVAIDAIVSRFRGNPQLPGSPRSGFGPPVVPDGGAGDSGLNPNVPGIGLEPMLEVPAVADGGAGNSGLNPNVPAIGLEPMLEVPAVADGGAGDSGLNPSVPGIGLEPMLEVPAVATPEDIVSEMGN